MTQAEAIQVLLQQASAYYLHKPYRAVENMDAGDFVTLFLYTNTEFRIRRATGTGAGEAHGFIKNPVLAGDFAWFHPLGEYNDCLSGLVFGQFYYVDPSQPGKVTLTSPTGTDGIQIVGKAYNATILDTKIHYLLSGTGGGGSPTGPAGGDLSGSYPNPNVVWANSYPTLDLRYYPLSSNPAGYITSAALAPYLTSATAAATYVALAGSYADPSWITSLAYSKLTGAPTIPTVTPSALTKVDDTNVTLTLGGTPSTALLQAVSLTLGWTGTLADARIASAATWNAKVSGKAYISVTNSTAVTGTTANTLADSVLVTGGTFTVGEIIHVTARAIKTGNAGTSTIRVYVNTTAALAGATLVSTWTTTAAANLFFQSERHMMIKTTTNTQVANSSASSAIDNAQIGAVSTLNIDWTTDKYFVFAIQNGNNADSTVISGYRVKDF